MNDSNDMGQADSGLGTSGLIVSALQSLFRARRDEAIANLSIYVNRSAGIGDHPNDLKECANLVEQISSAEESLRTVQNLFSRKAS